MVEATKKSPGFRGITVIVPDGDPDARIILYRFADIATMENWENSPERKQLLSEVDKYATQVYDKASGLETWFHVPDNQPMSKPPPKWKMAAVIFFAAGITSFVSHSILNPYVSGWSLVLTTGIYTVVLTLILTYVAMPYLTTALRGWLYPKR